MLYGMLEFDVSHLGGVLMGSIRTMTSWTSAFAADHSMPILSQLEGSRFPNGNRHDIFYLIPKLGEDCLKFNVIREVLLSCQAALCRIRIRITEVLHSFYRKVVLLDAFIMLFLLWENFQ